MNDGRFYIVEILERADELHDDGSGLLLWYGLVLLEVEVQVVAVAVLEHRAERVVVDREQVEQTHHSGVVQRLVDVLLAEGMSGST